MANILIILCIIIFVLENEKKKPLNYDLQIFWTKKSSFNNPFELFQV